MPILYGAVAYRDDLGSKFEREKVSWELAKHADVVGCPGGCPVQYDLYTEINASDEQVCWYIDEIHKRLEAEPKHDHAERIQFS